MRIYLFCALYAEAASLIHGLHLKQTDMYGSIQAFQNEHILLALTGTGPLSAASVTAAVLAKENDHENDLLISFGSCAGLGSISEGLYVLGKITDVGSGRSRYPDIRYNTGCPVKEALSGPKIYTQNDRPDHLPERYSLYEWVGENRQELQEYDLYDMESAAVYQAGSLFLGPHQMLFFRFVSDTGTQLPDAKKLQTDAGKYTDLLIQIIEKLYVQEEKKEEDGVVRKLAEDLCCSVTMERQLQKLLHYADLAGIPWRERIEVYYREEILPVKTREEGKKICHEIERFILE